MKATHKSLDVLIRCEQRLNDRDYQGCLKLLDYLRPILDTSDLNCMQALDYYQNWGWYYQHRLRASAALGLADELDCVRELVARYGTGIDRAQLFSTEFRQMRYALRLAYTSLATQALNDDRWKDAVRHIDACFKLKFGWGKVLDPFQAPYETKAKVYLRASQSDPKRFQSKFHEALHLLEKQAAKNRNDITTSDPELQISLMHPDYLAFKTATPIDKLRQAPANETWQSALHRYDKARKLLKLKARTEQNAIEVMPKEPEAALVGIERTINRPLPQALRACYTEHGPVLIRDREEWGHLRLYATGKYEPKPFIDGIVRIIEWSWGGRPEFAGTYDPDQIARLNAEYFCFGHYFHDDNAFTYLAFDAQGRFLRFYFNQDLWHDARKRFDSLLRESDATLTFDSLISLCVNDLIAHLIELKEEEERQA